MNIYYYIYKTLHPNGMYYIGRHSTNNINDGYIGSGNWIKSIKDKSILNKEIIKEAESEKELLGLEKYYINLYWDDPLCMNISKNSVGFTSENSKSIQADRIKNKTHQFLTKADGSSFSSDLVKSGKHHFLKRKDGTSVSYDRTIAGDNPFSTRKDGTSLQQDLVKSGKHHFLSRIDGTNIQTDRIKNGTHNLIGGVTCRNKSGEVCQIPVNMYNKQLGNKNDWEFVHITSKEGKRRKSLLFTNDH